MIEIEIDGQKLEIPQGTMIIEAADNAGIAIPRFCYHKKLSVAANCRMCLVEVEKVGKPLPACATPVTPGMKVFTKSAKAIDAQKSVMEFLLINHPLDCPICDQGGACELQDMSMGYGPDVSRYSETKRSVKDEDLGSLIATDMTRCIQCTRCVRFGQEVAGQRELGTIGRGEHMQIGTYLKSEMLSSELSGNVIDLCPVGALTSKPFRFTARAWELEQQEFIAPHDAVGSNIYLHTRRGVVMRVVPKENESINETWISDRDRFSYEGLYSKDRLTRPMIKKAGQWQEADWTEALNTVAKKLKHTQPQQLAAIASPNSTLEEFYLLQKIMRDLGSNNIDHRLHQTDMEDQGQMPLYPSLGINIADIEKQQTILIIGSNIRHEQPIIAHRIRKASLQGTKVLCVNSVDYPMHFALTQKKIVSPSTFISAIEDMAQYLSDNENTLIMLGADAMNHPYASVLRATVHQIAQGSNAKVAYLSEGANSAGAWLAGAVPHRKTAGESLTMAGLNTQQAFEAKLNTYVLLNIEPDCDLANSSQALKALEQAESVIAFTPYKTASLLDHAEILLPISIFAENTGTYINIEGRWQNFAQCVSSIDQARPAWKILRVLGNLLELQNFNYETADDVVKEIRALTPQTDAQINLKIPLMRKTLEKNPSNVWDCVSAWPMYRQDMLLRKSPALQKAALNTNAVVKINSHSAALLKVRAGDTLTIQQANRELALPVVIDESVVNQCVVIPSGFSETAALDHSVGYVNVRNH